MAAEWMPLGLPQCVRYGIDVNPMWRVDVVSLTDGRESPNLVWSQARHEYSLSVHTTSPDEYAAAKAHFMEARGMLKAWPFRDPLDHACVVAEGAVVAAPGGWRIAKRYGTGAGAYLRTISRPVAPVLYDGASVAVGITIDTQTGMLVGAGGGFDPATYTWAGEFRVPVRYDVDKFPSRVTNRTSEGFFVMVEGINVVEVRE